MKRVFYKALGLKKPPATIFETVWLGMPLAVWFSFQPLLRIGKDSTMYFELSIAVLYVTILAVAGIPIAWRHRKTLWSSTAARLTGLFVAVGAVGLIWDDNLTRGVLTLGVMGSLLIVFLASLAQAAKLRRLFPVLVRLFVGGAVIMSILSIVQFVAGIWFGRDATLLCAGCVAEQFGFPRPNVFTIEPQFFGNLLLTPGLMLLRWFLVKKDKWTAAALTIVTIALCLTLSRGAMFAFAIGVVLLFVVYHGYTRRILLSVGLLVASFVVSLCAQGIAAELNPTVHDTFTDVISKTVNQLSLGIIDFPVDEQKPVQPVTEKTPHYDGYVAESTDVRVNLSNLALGTWSHSAFSAFFGVGLGGSGVAMHQTYPREIDARQIVQNEYLEILLEMGMIGFGLFAAMLAGLIYQVRHHKWLWAIIAAYLVQWNFFSGYPNALHIYLIFILIFVVYATGPRGQSVLASRS